MRKTLAIFVAVSLWSGIASAQQLASTISSTAEDYMMLERPMIMKNGKFQADARLGSTRIQINLGGLGVLTSTTHAINVAASYGLMDIAEATISTGLNFNQGAGWNKQLGLGIGVKVIEGEKVDIAPRVAP